MMPGTESDRVLLGHIRQCIERIEEYTGGDRTRFCDSHLVQDAVVRNLQTLAESTQRLSGPLKATEPAVPWSAISGFRNILAHNYLGIDLAVVWSPAYMSHHSTVEARDTTARTSLRLLAVLDVLFKYVCARQAARASS